MSTISPGRTTHVKARNGRARVIAETSGCEMAHDLGAISPTTMCRKTTIATAMTTAMRWVTASGMPAACSTGSSSEATAGSDRAPKPRVHRVMPS